MNTLVIPSPAKINLFLKVVGRRTDGYHEIVSLLCRVGLFDTVSLAFDQPCISIDCTNPSVPRDRGNLAYRAAQLFFDALSIQDGVAISLDKHIPVAAGMGGGSGNAASVLMGLNQHYDSPFSNRELMNIGLKVGADVPFFIFGHAAIARGIGEQLEPFEGVPEWSAVLVCPKFEVSTAWVYRNLTLGLTNCEKSFKYHHFQDFSKIKSLLCNDLEQVTIGKFPEIKTIKKALFDLGAEIALMSGSGPSVFGLFKNEQLATNATHSIKQKGRWDTVQAELLLP